MRMRGRSFSRKIQVHKVFMITVSFRELYLSKTHVVRVTEWCNTRWPLKLGIFDISNCSTFKDCYSFVLHCNFVQSDSGRLIFSIVLKNHATGFHCNSSPQNILVSYTWPNYLQPLKVCLWYSVFRVRYFYNRELN